MEGLVQIRSRVGDQKADERQKLYIRTFGCQMNEYDSAKLAKILETDYDSVKDLEGANLVIINTCSVRDKPEQKLYSLLGEMRELKARNPGLLVGVGGCVAQQEGEKIVKRSSVVDFVFGTHNLSLVPSLVKRRKEGAKPQVAVDYRDEWEELPLGLNDKNKVSTFVSISRGCNKNCTYCIVPTTRGPEVSRAIQEIEKEVRIAVHRGAREVVLLGQTVNSYGRDMSPKMTFVELLDRVSAIQGVERIRFTSPHPQEVRQDFIDLVRDNPKVCRHIHMPLQSGSDRILKAMNRNYRRARYLSIIDALKSGLDDMAVTTDIIVGFPGETEKDFEDTLAVMDHVQFENSYSFVYSQRPGTPASDLPDELPYEAKLERLKILQAKQDELTARKLSSWVGRDVEVLFEGPSQVDPTRLYGRSSQNFTVNLMQAYPDLKPGMIGVVSVKEASKYTLKGELSKICK
jgi:tRNA-2-methylthio-N6-dimethylallyladenosine synthase